MIPPEIVKALKSSCEMAKVYARSIDVTPLQEDIHRQANIALAYLDTLPAAPVPDTREALAEYAHDAWSGWMEYMFSKCDQTGNAYATIPTWAVRRWQRQMNTPYVELPEEEKESDRAEADKMLAIMGRTTLRARPTE